jgi:hypothetical protein
LFGPFFDEEVHGIVHHLFDFNEVTASGRVSTQPFTVALFP